MNYEIQIDKNKAGFITKNFLIMKTIKKMIKT